MPIGDRVHIRYAVDELLGWRLDLADEERPQFARKAPSRFGMACQRGDQIEAVLHAARCGPRWNGFRSICVNREAECLRVGVVLRGVIEELIKPHWIARLADALKVPAGKDTRARIDVRLGESADADREQLHHLTREIFLWARTRVQAAIEPVQHGGIARHFEEEIAKVRQRVITEQFQLAPQPGWMFRSL